jgi:hypothetical protein
MSSSIQNQGDKFRPWVEETLRPRFPELEAPLMAAVDAFDATQNSGQLLPERLLPILDAVSSPRRPLYENTCDFMRTLSARWPEANAAILTMSHSSKAHVRFNAILCLGKGTPATTVKTVLKAGLVDKSSRVRSKAADWIGRLRNVELVPELGAALATEQDPKTRSTMEFQLRLLRDGYILEPRPDGVYCVTVHTKQGGVMSSFVQRETLNARGIDVIVSELRQKEPYETIAG